MSCPAMTGRHWQPDGCPFAIECAPAVLEELRRDVEDALHSPRGASEIGGVLFGDEVDGRIRILASRLLKCEHAMGPGFVLSARDEKRLQNLIALPSSERELAGLAALGWYHSHVHSKIFLSDRDLEVHARYFPAPRQVALVLRPSREHPTRAGFFFREATGEIHAGASYEEFTLNPPPEPKVEEPAPEPVRRSARPKAPAPVRKPREEAEPVCPKCGSRRIRRSRRKPVERLWELFGFDPWRCEECLSRFLRRSSPGLIDRAHAHSRKRPEERKRAWLRTRREVLLYSGGILGFLLFLLYAIRDTGPKQDQP